MWIEVAKVNEIALGGMIFVETNGKQIVLCNYDGKIYALERRCGHMNASLEMGTLDGYILTCPFHEVQFDIITGEALSQPLSVAPNVPLPQEMYTYFGYIGMLMSHIRVCDNKIYPTKIEGASIFVDI